jgi:hypothetical protein
MKSRKVSLEMVIRIFYSFIFHVLRHKHNLSEVLTTLLLLFMFLHIFSKNSVFLSRRKHDFIISRFVTVVPDSYLNLRNLTMFRVLGL